MTDSGPTILLIEDEAQMLRFLRASLSSNGYRVFEAETGEAGIAAVASRNPDLILYAGRVITHQQLLKEVWGPGSRDQTQYLRVYMGQLRHKLEKNPSRPQFLTTEAGVGYRLRTQD